MESSIRARGNGGAHHEGEGNRETRKPAREISEKCILVFFWERNFNVWSISLIDTVEILQIIVIKFMME